MSPLRVSGGDSGRNAYSHALVSSGDDFNGTPTRRDRFAEKRKAAKLRRNKMKAAQRRRIASNEDSELSEEADAEDGGAFANSEGSDDEDPAVLAPSAATPNNKTLLKLQSQSFRPMSIMRQAGRRSPKEVSFLSPKRQSPRHLLPAFEPQDGMFREAPRESLTPSPSVVNPLSQDAPLDEAVLEDVEFSDIEEHDYENADISDDSEPDDDEIEKEEEKYLISHLEQTGELPNQLTFLDAYNECMSRRNNSPERDTVAFGSYILPSTEIPHQEAVVNSGYQSIEFPSLDDPPQSSPLASRSGNKVMSPAHDGPSDAEWKQLETGLRTPNSLAQPMGHDDDTDHEDPKIGSISGARFKRVAGHTATTMVASAGVKKFLKPKTPKRASWKLSKKETTISHRDNGQLVISKKGKVAKSGTITPRGVVLEGGRSRRPSLVMSLPDPFLDMSVTCPSSVQTSPVVNSKSTFDFPSVMSTPIGRPFSDLAMPSSVEQHTDAFQDLVDF